MTKIREMWGCTSPGAVVCRERLGGPHRLGGTRGPGAGRVCLRSAPPLGGAYQDGGTYAHDSCGDADGDPREAPGALAGAFST